MPDKIITINEVADMSPEADFQTAKVTALKPKSAGPSLTDEVLDMLEGLAAEIRAGKVSPSYLVIGYGQDTTTDNGIAANAYLWDAVGLSTYELIGHMNTYAIRLAMGEGE